MEYELKLGWQTPNFFFATVMKRCLVAKKYVDKRLAELKTVYLSVINKPQLQGCGTTHADQCVPMGKNTINSSLKDVSPAKKLTNHSARKTVVIKLKRSGIPNVR